MSHHSRLSRLGRLRCLGPSEMPLAGSDPEGPVEIQLSLRLSWLHRLWTFESGVSRYHPEGPPGEMRKRLFINYCTIA
jgi:hypothetical protein